MGHNLDNKSHREKRAVLRMVGGSMVVAGLVLTAIGLISFFSAFGSFGSPRYFWCAIIGLPLLGIGMSICKFAYMGTITRFMASEVTPVGKDTVNYMVDGTKDAVREVASAIGEGLSASMNDQQTVSVRCLKCYAENDKDANFCNNCGETLNKMVICPSCNEQNDPDAKFCDSCGGGLD